MKLAVSNIAWANDNTEAFLEFISSMGCHGVELAINKIWNEPISANGDQINQLRKSLDKFNIEMIGFHSLLYTRPDLKFFPDVNNFRETCEYIRLLAKLCQQLGGSRLVLGSPRNREIVEIDYEQAWGIAVKEYRRLSEELFNYNVKLLFEPLSPKDTNFGSSLNEVIELASTINHSNFGLVVDAGVTAMSSEDQKTFAVMPINHLGHFHVNDPGLKPPGSNNDDQCHISFSENLKKVRYNDYISIEMLSPDNSNKHIINAINYVKEIYSIN